MFDTARREAVRAQSVPAITWTTGVVPRIGLPLLAACALLGSARVALALPSYARQTGAPCTACHTAFPQLTPFGRWFKLNAYTFGDAEQRLLPMAAMLQGAPGFTRTRRKQAPEDVPSGFHTNDNASMNQGSLFYAGRLFGPYASDLFGDDVGSALDHMGAFVQVTWDGVEHHWAWDNAEIRAATNAQLAGRHVLYGAYVNNSPSLQDPFNTTPTWGFPFSDSGLAPAPAAAPLIAGGLAQQVLGAGGYALVDETLYLEVGGYENLSDSAQRKLGVDPEDETRLRGLAPYWRVALKRDRGASSFEIGTFGMAAKTYPGNDRSAGHDSQVDVGVDLQYQWLTRRNDVTFLGAWVHEAGRYAASRRLGAARDLHNPLWSTSLTLSYLRDRTFGVDVQRFRTGGSADPLLYPNRTGRPDSSGWVFQLNWLPFNAHGGPSIWPHSGLKLSLQYTAYSTFDGSSHDYDGSGRDARDNNTLYLEAWWAF